jgi:hypothetical protein
VQGNKNKAPTIIHTPEYARDLPGLRVFAIYPDYWGQNVKYKGIHNWGEGPCLGYVKEQDAFWAEKAAYTCGLVPTYNATFKPKAVLIKTQVGHKPWVKKHKKEFKRNGPPSNKV